MRSGIGEILIAVTGPPVGAPPLPPSVPLPDSAEPVPPLWPGIRSESNSTSGGVLPASNSTICITSSWKAYEKQRHCHSVVDGEARHGELVGSKPVISLPQAAVVMTLAFESNESMNASLRDIAKMSSSPSSSWYCTTDHAPSSSKSLPGGGSEQAGIALPRARIETRCQEVGRACMVRRADWTGAPSTLAQPRRGAESSVVFEPPPFAVVLRERAGAPHRRSSAGPRVGASGRRGAVGVRGPW
jgi:hypothetical protein